MYSSLKLMFLLFISVKAQDPRKRLYNAYSYPLDETELSGSDDEYFPCRTHAWYKRSSGQDELGPFWANRGKKDPTYRQERLSVQEPNWVLITKYNTFPEEPFFTSRGKKDINRHKYYSNNNIRLRNRREFVQADGESPFFAARGKRIKQKNDKF